MLDAYCVLSITKIDVIRNTPGAYQQPSTTHCNPSNQGPSPTPDTEP